MGYRETIEYLYQQIPMFHRIGAAAYKADLNNTLALDKMFKSPHHHYKTIHVAGTNGKGSVSHMLAAILQCASYKVGLYTSPHLKDFRERIKVNGTMITEDAVVGFVSSFIEKNRKVQIQPSFFELTVMMAFHYFAQQQVDVAVIEVGLGGRLDSTNIITPELSVITNISFDHMNLLGNTLEKIAFEKAGIIKPQIPVVVGETVTETKPIFLEKAKENNSHITLAEEELFATIDDTGKFTVSFENDILLQNIDLELKGIYQSKNLTTVMASVVELRKKRFTINDNAILEGLRQVVTLTGLMGRWQVLREKPLVICDTGHNEAGIRYVVEQISGMPYNSLFMVFGMVNDKDVRTVLSLLPVDATYFFAKANVERAMAPESLKEIATEFSLKGNTYLSVEAAYNAALKTASDNDLIFIGGSTFVVAEVV